MSRPSIRPATLDDFSKLIDEPLPWRCRAWAVEKDDELLGVGGFAYHPGDVIAAFVLKGKNAEQYPVALHRAGLMAMQEAKRNGYRRIVALAQRENPAAERWLARLGFREVMIDGKPAWVWTA